MENYGVSRARLIC